jgi:MFS family permease
MWNTSSNVLLSDITTTHNRGRALALRQMSTRFGFVLGPFVAGIVAYNVDLQSVFLINGASKVVIVLTVLFLVRETLRRAAPERAGVAGETDTVDRETAKAAVARAMRTKSFLALAITVVGFAMTQAALLQALLPVYVGDVLEIGESGVGFLVSLAAALAVLVAYPNGMLTDRLGRKASLVPGLLLLSLASTVLTLGDTYALILFAVAIQGSGEGMAQGTTHTYAMDIAPPDHRGSFLGVVMMFQAAGSFAGPMFVGALYNYVSHDIAFGALAAWMAFAALAMALWGRETAGPRARAHEEPAPRRGSS